MLVARCLGCFFVRDWCRVARLLLADHKIRIDSSEESFYVVLISALVLVKLHCG